MNDGSRIFGMSVRAFIALVITLFVCVMSSLTMKVEEPLYSAFLLSLGFFFGQKAPIINNGGNK